jgi:hypothetical protein
MDNFVEREKHSSRKVTHTTSRTSTKLITVYHCSHSDCYYQKTIMINDEKQKIVSLLCPFGLR